MRDVLGWRCKLGVIGASTNTLVEPEYDAMRPPRVTHHYSRIFTPDACIDNQSFEAGVAVIRGNVADAAKSVMTCRPDHLVVAMSAISFSGGAAGGEGLVRGTGWKAWVGCWPTSDGAWAAVVNCGGLRALSARDAQREEQGP